MELDVECGSSALFRLSLYFLLQLTDEQKKSQLRCFKHLVIHDIISPSGKVHLVNIMSHSAASLHKPTWNCRSKPCQTLWGVLASHLSMAVQQGFTFAFVYATCLNVWRDAFFCATKNPFWVDEELMVRICSTDLSKSLRLHQVGWILLGLLLHALTQAIPGATCRNVFGWKSLSCRKERVRGVSKMMKNTENPFILKKVIRNYLPGS